MVKTDGRSQTQLWRNLKKSKSHPPEGTLPCIDCQKEDPCCPVLRGSSPTWGQKWGTQAGDCPVSLGTPHARRTGGVKQGFDSEDPALARFPKVSVRETCSTTTDTLWEFLPCIYCFKSVLCTALLPGLDLAPKLLTKLSSSWTGRKLLCVLMTHPVVVSSQYQEICFMHEMYLIQKSQW